MRKKLFIAVLLSLNVFSVFAIDWKNPPVMCPEEILPKGKTCPDFSKVTNVYTDFPDAVSVSEIKDWKTNFAADLRLCRNTEVLRREKLVPGTYSPATIEDAWMIVNGGENVKEKLEAVEAATVKYQIPPQILLGAMRQESLLSSLGISVDGGNYSCGMSQLNIQEWCSSINKLSSAEKIALGWPLGVSCDGDILPTEIVKPFYDLAVLKLGTRPSYQLTAEDFEGITFDQVVSGFPSATDEIQKNRFKAITSFVAHCQDISLSVDFKANTLSNLFLNFVPSELREQNLYKTGETFNRKCDGNYMSNAYPLHTGWLMAVAMYNAGPRQRSLVDYYFQIQDNNYPNLSPLDLIEALHWGGKAKKKTDVIEFRDQDGKKLTQKWYKSCIVQRHVARVIQHATLPADSIAKSLEQAPCKLNERVPEYRKITSGKK